MELQRVGQDRAHTHEAEPWTHLLFNTTNYAHIAGQVENHWRNTHVLEKYLPPSEKEADCP